MFRYIKSRVVLSLASLFLLLGVAAMSYALPNVQGQGATMGMVGGGRKGGPAREAGTRAGSLFSSVEPGAG